jgi:hypothetical protein
MKIFEEFNTSVTINGVVYSVTVCHREWNPLPGHTPPTDTVWEAFISIEEESRCGIGGSADEAIQNLVRLVEKMNEWRRLNPGKDLP